MSTSRFLRYLPGLALLVAEGYRPLYNCSMLILLDINTYYGPKVAYVDPVRVG